MDERLEELGTYCERLRKVNPGDWKHKDGKNTLYTVIQGLEFELELSSENGAHTVDGPMLIGAGSEAVVINNYVANSIDYLAKLKVKSPKVKETLYECSQRGDYPGMNFVNKMGKPNKRPELLQLYRDITDSLRNYNDAQEMKGQEKLTRDAKKRLSQILE